MPRVRKEQKPTATKAPRAFATTQSLSAFVKSICDIMRRSNCASALQYVPELTWILFLRILDAQEAKAREAAEAVGKHFMPALREPYRWQDWAAPYDERATRVLRKENRSAGNVKN
jgi:type I restriction enzyme M protein